jgi:hypothetical protein
MEEYGNPDLGIIPRVSGNSSVEEESWDNLLQAVVFVSLFSILFLFKLVTRAMLLNRQMNLSISRIISKEAQIDIPGQVNVSYRAIADKRFSYRKCQISKFNEFLKGCSYINEGLLLVPIKKKYVDAPYSWRTYLKIN